VLALVLVVVSPPAVSPSLRQAGNDRAEMTPREELIEQGWTVFPGVVSPEHVEELNRVINDRVHAMDHYVRPDGKTHERHKGDHLHLAFNEKVSQRPMGGAGVSHSSLTRLVANPRSLAALEAVGCADRKFWSGYVLSKPAGGPPLYWHNDWQFWEDPVSADPMPIMMFGMVYLCDTTSHNGCLRVVPRSHRRDGPVWDVIRGNIHLSAQRDADLEGDGIFTAPGVDVPMKAGDLLLGDSRILHGTHGNDSDARRTCITLWYLSRFESLPERIRAGFGNEWAGATGGLLLPGVDDEGVLERAGLIPRVDGAIGKSFPLRSGEPAVYPTEGAQDFLGSNLPTTFWADAGAAEAGSAKL